ncbi:MAG TPA: sulfite exporter TauE/SafE family protein [Leptospiraceae bacterium]|nr:sulfite exporter TauE/SafE family protein [Leptospiraceae bacterium]HRG75748.1 sulfite exporter TauE/SafE family protein [Leptospiraceae bacterium]
MLLLFFIGGVLAGIIAGLLGVGGGIIIVPMLVFFGKLPVNAVATSSLAIVITSISGSFQNWREGNLNFKKVISLGLPAVATAQLGVYLASHFSPLLLLSLFAILLFVNVYLVSLKRRLVTMEKISVNEDRIFLNTILTGGAAGILSGLFGVGGGVIMVPLQMLLLGEKIKVAIQTSLGVIILTAISASIGHAVAGNILLTEGLLIGFGGLVGAQFGTRFLPRLSDRVVTIGFLSFIFIIALSIVYQAAKYL